MYVFELSLNSQILRTEGYVYLQLQAYLASNNCGIESVTSTEHAKAFVGSLFPFIQIPLPASHGASATVAFYKALETVAQHSGKRVKIDRSQSATPHDKGRGGEVPIIQ